LAQAPKKSCRRRNPEQGSEAGPFPMAVEEDHGQSGKAKGAGRRVGAEGSVSSLLSNVYMRWSILGWKALDYARRSAGSESPLECCIKPSHPSHRWPGGKSGPAAPYSAYNRKSVSESAVSGVQPLLRKGIWIRRFVRLADAAGCGGSHESGVLGSFRSNCWQQRWGSSSARSNVRNSAGITGEQHPPARKLPLRLAPTRCGPTAVRRAVSGPAPASGPSSTARDPATPARPHHTTRHMCFVCNRAPTCAWLCLGQLVPSTDLLLSSVSTHDLWYGDGGVLVLSTPVDNPIHDPSQDLLGRVPFAALFARYVCSLDTSEGVVVGVHGPWGSGKTSFLNLAKGAFQERGVDVLELNPWYFSETGDVLNQFIGDLSSKMYRVNHLKKLAPNIAQYSQSIAKPLTSILGYPWISVLFLTLSHVLRYFGRPKTLQDIRDKIVNDLSDMKEPLIIMIDDVDRLTRAEMRAVFKLVRLIGRFPNLIYIVACDKDQVEESLSWGNDRRSGRKYMEKIIQYPVNLPEIPRRVVFDQVENRIKKIIESTDRHCDNTINSDRWPDIRSNIVFPLLNNMRDVNRFLAALPATFDNLKGTVAAVDLIALEAVRLFLPDVFVVLPTVIDVITIDLGDQDSKFHEGEDYGLNSGSFGWGWNQRSRREYQVKSVRKMLKMSVREESEIPDQAHPEFSEYMVISALMEHVFPSARQSAMGETVEGAFRSSLDNSNRICIRHVFRKYLMRLAAK